MRVYDDVTDCKRAIVPLTTKNVDQTSDRDNAAIKAYVLHLKLVLASSQTLFKTLEEGRSTF